MINFDSLTLKIFYEENKDFFSGAKIQKIQQPNRSELIFYIRNNGETRKFYINFNPSFYHLCFMSSENEQKRHLSVPKTAPMFCMLLRKYIQNAKITKVCVPKYERIFEIYFEYYDELNEKTELCLAVELMGKYSNVILYNYDNNIIIGCGHNVSSEKSRERELSGLLPYVYPKKQKKKDLLKIKPEEFEFNPQLDNCMQILANNYYYVTIPIIQNILKKSENISSHELYNKLKNYICPKEYTPSIKKDYSEFMPISENDGIECPNINAMIDNYFTYHQMLQKIGNLKNKALNHIKNRLKKLYVLKEKQLQRINEIDKAVIYKEKADLIMANLYYLKDIQKEITLINYDNKEIKIDFDINLTAKENANKYYNLYKKTKSATEYAKNMLEETLSQILYYEETEFFINEADDIEELNDINSELFDENYKKKEVQEKIDSIEYQNYKIYIGKNKKQNDYILSKLSNAEDLWFHPLNVAGAHILIKSKNNNEEIPDEVKLKAAIITKEYSSQKNNSKTSIIYTKRKYVKKANNKTAFVTYKNETEIVV